MRILIILLFLAINISGCQFFTPSIDGKWTLKYTSESLDDGLSWKDQKVKNNIVWSFDKDSLIEKMFDYENHQGRERTAHCIKEGSDVFLYFKGFNVIFEIVTLTEKELIVMIKSDTELNKAVFEKLKNFKQSKNIEKLEKQLKSTVYKDCLSSTDSVWIEFGDNQRFYTSELLSYLTSDQSWNIQTFEDELFLIIDDLWDVIIHISAISDHKITGLVYGKENRNIEYNKIKKTPYFDINQLAGEWEEIDVEDIPRPSWVEKSKKHYPKENLRFAKDTIFQSKFFKTDTTIWTTNLFQNQIIFPNMWGVYKHQNRKWIIEHLSEKKMTIRRLEREEYIKPVIRKFTFKIRFYKTKIRCSMINLVIFIKQCESDLIANQMLSESTFALASDLSDRNKILCEPLLNCFELMRNPVPWSERKQELEDLLKKKNAPKGIEFLSEERILVCRLIPLAMSLNTGMPRLTSYMLTLMIRSANNIIGIKLSEIVSAFLEIFCEFKTPLNHYIASFCINLSKEFYIYYRDRLAELDSSGIMENSNCSSIPSVALLRFYLVDDDKPTDILKTMIALIDNEQLKRIFESTRYLFEDLEFKRAFLEGLSNSELPQKSKNLILSEINS